jgi:hypothetical protein
MLDLSLFADTTTAEKEAWENFKKRYTDQVPPPAKPSVRLMQSIGWQFVLILLQSAGAITLASLRTAEMFYRAASGSNIVLRYVEAAAAILAVEFGIIVFAAIRAEETNRARKSKALLHSINVSMKRLLIGEVFGVLVSIVAGLGVSFTGFDVDIDLGPLLAVVIGVGASVIAAISGDILGAMLARYGNLKDSEEAKYRQEYAAWQSALFSSWEHSPDRQIARVALSDARKAMRGGSRVRLANERSEQASEVRGRIWAYLEQNSTGEFVPGPTQVANELGVSKGYASDVIKEFRAQHFQALQPAPIGDD